jgi:membrane-associated phospholipid phosphatase
MEAILQWGLDCIRLIQGMASPPVTLFFRIITEMGSANAYIIIPFIFWCVDEKKSFRLALAVFISAWLNLALKMLVNQPRPFFEAYDPSLGMITERFGGFPSGHAQISLVMWIIIASWGKKKWHYVAAALFCLLVGLSRVYLGVHFPTDVFGGWLIGGVLLCVYFLAGSRIEKFLAGHGPRAGLIAGAALAFIMILYRPLADMVMLGGMILGLVTGYFLCTRYINFTAASCSGRSGAAKYLNLVVRFLLGITGLVLLFVASGKIINKFYPSGNDELFAFLRFALITLWVSAGAPWLFCLLRLAEKTENNVINYQEDE